MNTNSGTNITDKQLINNVLAGDTASFGQLIKNTEALVAQITFKMISNTEDRKDLAQEVYLKAFRNLSGFKFQSKFSTWIAQIAYNSCTDYLRKKKLVLTGSLDEESDSIEDANTGFFVIPTTNETHALMQQRELSAILKKEIELLPPLYKTLVSLYHQEELSYDEIGQITQLPEGTVKSYLFRARKTLKNNLLKNYQKEDI